MSTPIPHLDAIGIVVSDLKKALPFYALLGLTFELSDESEQHVETTTAQGVRVMLDTESMIASFNDAAFTKSPSRVGLAFLCVSSAEVDEIYEHVVAAGYTGTTPPWDAPWGQRYAQVADPDGTVSDLFANL